MQGVGQYPYNRHSISLIRTFLLFTGLIKGHFLPFIVQVALMIKNPPANAGSTRDVGSVPGLGRSPGEGHGNPLQYSCLENPMDRGAWWATVHRTEKSQTQMKRFSMCNICKFCQENAYWQLQDPCWKKEIESTLTSSKWSAGHHISAP